MFGDGSQTRDYVFVKDVARANLAAATRDLPAPGRLDARGFNIGTGVETSVVQFAETLQKSAGLDACPSRSRRRDPASSSGPRSASRRRSESWAGSRQVNLHDGLEETFEFFAARLRAGAADDVIALGYFQTGRAIPTTPLGDDHDVARS